MAKKDTDAPTYDFVKPGDKTLSEVSSAVPVAKIASPKIQQLISGMFRVALGEQGDKKRRTMVGLAAPQIGIGKRVLIAGTNSVGLGEQPELKVFINPEIIEASDETEDGREGCYSTDRVCGVVKRSKRVIVRAYDHKGNISEESYGGFPARILQHEVDHLNGIRFPDRITDDKKLHWVEPDKFGEYRKHWSTWEEYCPREKWESIKADN